MSIDDGTWTLPQHDLFPDVVREAPYQRTSKTSRAAARRVRPKAGTQRARVLAFLEAPPWCDTGATREEIAFQLRIPLQSVCARVNELMQQKFVAETGQERPTQWGGSAAVVRVRWST